MVLRIHEWPGLRPSPSSSRHLHVDGVVVMEYCRCRRAALACTVFSGCVFPRVLEGCPSVRWCGAVGARRLCTAARWHVVFGCLLSCRKYTVPELWDHRFLYWLIALDAELRRLTFVCQNPRGDCCPTRAGWEWESACSVFSFCARWRRHNVFPRRGQRFEQ